MNFTREQEQEAQHALEVAEHQRVTAAAPKSQSHIRKVRHQKTVRELARDWWETYGLNYAKPAHV